MHLIEFTSQITDEIDLVREVPEAMKPRRIEIATRIGDRGTGDNKVLENTADNSDGRVEQLKRAYEGEPPLP